MPAILDARGNADVDANYPFEADLDEAGLAANSFFEGQTQDRFMEMIWRISSWNVTTQFPLNWFPGGPSDPTYYFTVLTDSFPVLSGASPGGSPPFVDADDILTGWRKTIAGKTEIVVRPNPPDPDDEFTQTSYIEWGENGVWFNTRRVADVILQGYGKLTSRLLFTAFEGDVFGYLGTEYGAAVGTGFLTRSSGLYLRVGTEVNHLEYPLYQDDISDLPFNVWDNTTGLIYLTPYTYFPYNINGSPTYNVLTGVQELPHDRTGANGFPLIHTNYSAR